jgi:hypothetical protein
VFCFVLSSVFFDAESWHIPCPLLKIDILVGKAQSFFLQNFFFFFAVFLDFGHGQLTSFHFNFTYETKIESFIFGKTTHSTVPDWLELSINSIVLKSMIISNCFKYVIQIQIRIDFLCVGLNPKLLSQESFALATRPRHKA